MYIFSERFSLVDKQAVYDSEIFFVRWRNSHRTKSIFNRVDQIDGLDDTNRTLASNYQKKFLITTLAYTGIF